MSIGWPESSTEFAWIWPKNVAQIDSDFHSLLEKFMPMKYYGTVGSRVGGQRSEIVYFQDHLIKLLKLSKFRVGSDINFLKAPLGLDNYSESSRS